MKKIFLIIIFFSFIFILPKRYQAQTITSPPEVTIIPTIEQNQFNDFLFNLLQIIYDYKPKYRKDNPPPINKNNTKTSPTTTAPPTSNFFDNKTTLDIKNNDLNSQSFPSPITNNIEITPDVNGLVYYPQCKGPYDNYPLPQGGNICKAGCGPTTVAMILASYVNRNINPEIVVNMYKERNYTLGPSGSVYLDAEKILKEYQFRTHYVLKRDKSMGGITIEEVMKTYGTQIKNLQNAGWTFFVLADFKAGGHFFWVVKFDDNLNIWAYDPAYDINKSKPINHKSRYPFPKFRVIMAIIR